MCLFTRSSRLQPPTVKLVIEVKGHRHTDIRDVSTEDLATLFGTNTWQNTVYLLLREFYSFTNRLVSRRQNTSLFIIRRSIDQIGSDISCNHFYNGWKRYHTNKGRSGITPPGKRVIRKIQKNVVQTLIS